MSKITPALHALGIDPAAYLSRAAPRHFIWRARRTVRERMTIAASMLNPVGGVSHVRVVYPLQAMRTDPSVSAYIGLSGEIAVPGRDEPHVFVLHRPGLVGEHGAAAIRTLLGEGWLIITEFDDHPDHFGMLHGDDQYSFSGVHAVQTSTPALAEVLRTRNPEVAIFPNMIRALPDVRNFLTPERLTLFFGALNREQDWAPLMPSINAIIEKVGDRLGFCVVHDRGFFDALQTPHKQFTPTCDHETYLTLLGQCEISLMPLSDNAFNRAKSDLKFIESGACRVAALASDIVYSASIEDGRTGLIFRNPEEFHDRLLRLIVMPDLARALGSAARSYVAGERMLAYQVAPRLAWYRALWSKRVELTNALYTRMALPRGITLSATPSFFDAGVPS